jgi:hypothetical protein
MDALPFIAGSSFAQFIIAYSENTTKNLIISDNNQTLLIPASSNHPSLYLLASFQARNGCENCLIKTIRSDFEIDKKGNEGIVKSNPKGRF